jgi:hypothetical protein
MWAVLNVIVHAVLLMVLVVGGAACIALVSEAVRDELERTRHGDY